MLTKILKYLRYAHALLKGSLIVFLLFILVNNSIMTVYTVDGHSMDPTLHNGQKLPLNLVAYLFKAPQKGDIVILAYHGNANVHFVKRITGVPGDQVMMNNSATPITLGADQYFVEGDNRDHSTDSRDYGPIKRSQILGKVYPL